MAVSPIARSRCWFQGGYDATNFESAHAPLALFGGTATRAVCFGPAVGPPSDYFRFGFSDRGDIIRIQLRDDLDRGQRFWE